jgi:penicillin amidase
MARKRSRPRRLLVRVLLVAFAAVAALVLVLALAGHLTIRASLPDTSGEVWVEGIDAPVHVARDGLGVPTITGESRADVAFALGFLHGQERFFQMDLMRRRAAGELSALVGAAALELDREVRVHRLRTRAGRVVEGLDPAGGRLLRTYAAGVDAGLSHLGARPFEYVLLREEPQPWTPEDTILVVYAMFLDLYDGTARYERTLGVMSETLPPALVAFLAPVACEPEAPLIGAPLPAPPVPSASAFDLRRSRRLHRPAAEDAREPPRPVRGSNNWAVAGHRTAHGRAMVANDMHLGLSVPNTWYRAVMRWPDGSGGRRRLVGVTLPGAPALVAGSTGRIAWGLTNAYADVTDVVLVQPDPDDPDRYLTPQGPQEFKEYIEKISVKGEEDREMTITSTIWGPVLGEDRRGRLEVLRFTAHDPEAIDLGIMRLEEASSVEEALALAPRSGIPPQNFVCADADGHVGWTVAGRLPRRFGHFGRLPCSWADGARGWDGYLEASEHPRVMDPPSGLLWTANSRVAGGEALARLGDGGYPLGSRARRIRDRLASMAPPTERDMLALQLDDKAALLERWRAHLLELLDEEACAGHPDREKLRELVDETWTGRASVDSAGYRLVRIYRLHLFHLVWGWLTAACAVRSSGFDHAVLRQWEASLWRLVQERPPNMLHPDFATWKDAMLHAADGAIGQCIREEGALERCTWGARNTTDIAHPLSRAVPWLSGWLDMHPRRLPGDANVIRVQHPSDGASERFVIAPGHEHEALFHMPCGQSGHPASPHYRDGHLAWEEGAPSPLLPGAAEETLLIVPRRGR